MEQWKPIPEFEGCYEVSDMGRIKSLSRIVGGNCKSLWRRKEALMTPVACRKGYMKVILKRPGKKKGWRMHQWVMSAFNPKPKEGLIINHINCNPGDNRLENLEWVTHSRNQLHAIENGLRIYSKGEDHFNSNFTALQIIAIRYLAKSGAFNYHRIAEIFSSEPSIIRKAAIGQTYSNVNHEPISRG